MISRTIKYVDYNGVEKIGEYWFNMSRADLMDLETKNGGGWFDRMKALIGEQNASEAWNMIREFVDDAYGVKTEDGRFDKDPIHLKKFKQSEAYSEFIWHFVEHPNEFADFVNGIVSSVAKRVDAIDVESEIAKAQAGRQGRVMNFVTPSNP
jgi:hypothetical protein